LENAFTQKLQTYEESKVMPYVTSIERMAKEEGQAAGRVEGRIEGRVEGAAATIFRLLRRRWNSLPPTIEERIRALSLEQLESLAEALLDFAGPGDLETWLAAH
jgi:predicted transposase YdaD